MAKLAFIMSGPQGGQVINMDDEDFTAAEKDGWAVDFEAANLGGNPDPFAGFNTNPHEKAEAYMAKQSGGLYAIREIRAAPPAEEKPAAAPERKPEQAPQPETATEPVKGKPGRPKKA